MSNSCFPAFTTLFTRRANNCGDNCDVERQGLTAGSESSAMCETVGKLARQSKFSIATEFLSNLFKAQRNNTKVYDEVVEKCVEDKNFRKVFITKFIQETEDRQLKHLKIQRSTIDYPFFLSFHKPHKPRLNTNLIQKIDDYLGKIILNGRNYLKYQNKYLQKPSQTDPKTKYIAIDIEDFLDKTIFLETQFINPETLATCLEKNNKAAWLNICAENKEIHDEFKKFKNTKGEEKQKAFDQILAKIDNFIVDPNKDSEKEYAITLSIEGMHAIQIYIQKGKIISTSEAFNEEFNTLEKLSASPLVKNYGFKLYTPPEYFSERGMLGTFYTCQAMAGSITQRIAKLTKAGIQPFIFDNKNYLVYPNPIIYSNAQSERFFTKHVELYNKEAKELNANEPDSSKHIKEFDPRDRKAYGDLPGGRTKDNLFYFLFKNLEGKKDISYMMRKLKKAHPEIMTAVLNDYAQNPDAWEQTTQKPTPPNQKTSNRN